MTVPARTALLSVSDKTGLVPFAQTLSDAGFALLSTGGSAKALREAGLTVTEVADYTGAPEVFEGRVKTLHPKVHGAILWDRTKDSHRAQAAERGISEIDLVVVNLYPFSQTVASGANTDTCIENIDIGGPAMVRASAKNHASVAIITDPADYETVSAEIAAGGFPDAAARRKLAAKAYAHTAAYDAAISGWMADLTGETFPGERSLGGQLADTLRYGENPHQSAAFYRTAEKREGVATAQQLQGKALSYNNINDTDAAFEAVAEFDAPTAVIVKHANPCGVASADSLTDAYQAALACDPTSAFGGIIALNRPLDAATAAEISQIFTEVIIAPGCDDAAREIIAKKPNLRLLTTDGLPDPSAPGLAMKTVAGGFLLQNRDAGRVSREQLTCVTKRQATDAEIDDLLFAFRVAKHVKSNAIILAKDGCTLGIGAGQMSRVDSSRIARSKALGDTTGCVVASDAFFPFADGLQVAIDAGATAVIQPGGSMRDSDVIAAADEAGLAMLFTGMRHFRH